MLYHISTQKACILDKNRISLTFKPEYAYSFFFLIKNLKASINNISWPDLFSSFISKKKLSRPAENFEMLYIDRFDSVPLHQIQAVYLLPVLFEQKGNLAFLLAMHRNISRGLIQITQKFYVCFFLYLVEILIFLPFCKSVISVKDRNHHWKAYPSCNSVIG